MQAKENDAMCHQLLPWRVATVRRKWNELSDAGAHHNVIYNDQSNYLFTFFKPVI